MNNKALVVIDIQNDITKHYRDIIDNINAAIEWAVEEGMQVVYIKHNNITDGTRTFKPGTKGEELVPEMKVVSVNIFVKTKSNALTSEAFSEFITANGIGEFYLAGADATACVKSTCFNMRKTGFTVHVISDCVTSYDLTKLPDMLSYYESKGCEVKTLAEVIIKTCTDKMIGYCGINCEKCEARIATIKNDNKMRERVAGKWCEMFHTDIITPDKINCTGCRGDGMKYFFCNELCKIKPCVTSKQYDSCAECPKMDSCGILATEIGNNEEARNNLKHLMKQEQNK